MGKGYEDLVWGNPDLPRDEVQIFSLELGIMAGKPLLH